MTIFNLVSLAVLVFLVSYMLRFRLSCLASGCVGRCAIESLCYSESFHVVYLVTKDTLQFHPYASLLKLIQNYIAKDLTIYVHHIILVGNLCSSFLLSWYLIIQIILSLSINTTMFIIFSIRWCFKCVLFNDLVFLFCSLTFSNVSKIIN